MSRLFGPIFQMAYVVPALEPAIEHWTKTLGVGPFFLFPTPLAFEWMKMHEEESTAYEILDQCAIAYSGDTMIEIIVPGRDPNIYREFLNKGGQGLHHLGTFATDYDAQMAAARAAGIKVAVEGKLPISRFSYLETDTGWPGTMIELIEAQPEMHEMFAVFKAAARDWDGNDPLRTLG